MYLSLLSSLRIEKSVSNKFVKTIMLLAKLTALQVDFFFQESF